ncbi:uncharacterized protein LOC132637303 [Lycium barbarum]|uniref:uncharacterized protein LOC132637303 n=1 Tax=Lycium barbarum TaxID=112863 RepID=UPI00293E9292|nr:uncharacterized protein LOC132637303 [Lycium barbarum]
MRTMKEARFPDEIRTNPNKRNTDLWCHFYSTHGHATEDCVNLRVDVAQLLRAGHLKEYISNRANLNLSKNHGNKPDEAPQPIHTINMMFEGKTINKITYTTLRKSKVSFTIESRGWDPAESRSISFTNSDREGPVPLHNNALVISVQIMNSFIKRVLIDPESSANIIQQRILKEMGIDDAIIPTIKVLVGFNMASELTQGEIELPVHADECGGNVSKAGEQNIRGTDRQNHGSLHRRHAGQILHEAELGEVCLRGSFANIPGLFGFLAEGIKMNPDKVNAIQEMSEELGNVKAV